MKWVCLRLFYLYLKYRQRGSVIYCNVSYTEVNCLVVALVTSWDQSTYVVWLNLLQNRIEQDPPTS